MPPNPPTSSAARDVERSSIDTAQSFRVLREHYQHSYRALYAQAFLRLRSAEAAEDAVQQAFVDTAVAIEGGTEIENMGGWLSRCVYYLCLKQLKRPDELPLIGDVPSLGGGDATAKTARARETVAEIKKAVDRLPRGQKSAFLLAEVHGLSYAEVADVLGKSRLSVRQLLSRARRQLQLAVGDDAPLHIQAYLSWQTHVTDAITKGRALGQLVTNKLAGSRAALASFFEQSADFVARPFATAVAVAVMAAGVTSVVTAPFGGSPPGPSALSGESPLTQPPAATQPGALDLTGQGSAPNPLPRPTTSPIGSLVPLPSASRPGPAAAAPGHSATEAPIGVIASPTRPDPATPVREPALAVGPGGMPNLPGEPFVELLAVFPEGYDEPPEDPGYEGPYPSGPGVFYRVCPEGAARGCFTLWLGADGTVLAYDAEAGRWIVPPDLLPGEGEGDEPVTAEVQATEPTGTSAAEPAVASVPEPAETPAAGPTADPAPRPASLAPQDAGSPERSPDEETIRDHRDPSADPRPDADLRLDSIPDPDASPAGDPGAAPDRQGSDNVPPMMDAPTPDVTAESGDDLANGAAGADTV